MGPRTVSIQSSENAVPDDAQSSPSTATCSKSISASASPPPHCAGRQLDRRRRCGIPYTSPKLAWTASKLSSGICPPPTVPACRLLIRNSIQHRTRQPATGNVPVAPPARRARCGRLGGPPATYVDVMRCIEYTALPTTAGRHPSMPSWSPRLITKARSRHCPPRDVRPGRGRRTWAAVGR